eukprot:GHVL01008970.1.p1 GENE.GHVL01008970.1~~GHVL01008970.1.p1  ORF type:complete len:321 (+),score=35.99 GHVL01008970.1:394-1356(+)
MHGLMMSSEIWVANSHLSLPLFLHQKGYDVWMANNRANKYSWMHTSLSRDDLRYWNFSIDELARFDVPTCIDYILDLCLNSETLAYVGFSNGTAQMFAALSSQPRLNKKVSIFIALAPACKLSQLVSNAEETKFPLQFLKLFPSSITKSWRATQRLQILYPLICSKRWVCYLIFGRRAVLSTADVWKRLLTKSIFVKLVEFAMKALFNWQIIGASEDDKERFINHLYSTTSVKSVAHWFQILRNGKFEHFDAASGISGEVEIPDYDISRIKCPVHVLYGNKDKLTDLEHLKACLGGDKRFTPMNDYEHVDCLVCSDAIDK